MRGKLQIGGGLLFAILAYSVYEPMPQYVKDRAVLTVGHALFHVVDAVGKVSEFFNLADCEVVRRLPFSILMRPVRNTSSVEFTYREFARSRTLIASPIDPSGRSGAAVVYFHGGGWVFGSPEMQSKLYAELADKTGAIVFAVRYRLAPEHKFPAAFDDCVAATEAIFESAQASGVDPNRIAIAGDSAGGQLAASVVQQLRRVGSRFKPKMQVMLFPVTQAVNLRTESYLSKTNEPLLKPRYMPNYISLYLTGSKAAAPWIHHHGHVTDKVKAVYERSTGDTIPTVAKASASGDCVNDSVASHVASLVTDFRVSPLLGDDLEKLGLPPAHILACEFDPLFDDSVMYAKRLERAGVRTHLRRFRTFHGATTLPNDGLQIRAYLLQVFRDEL